MIMPLPLCVNTYECLYQAQGNALMAELTHPKRGFFISEANYKAFDELTHNPHKTDWQALWLNYYPYTKGDIYECRGIYLFRQDRIDEALGIVLRKYLGKPAVQSILGKRQISE